MAGQPSMLYLSLKHHIILSDDEFNKQQQQQQQQPLSELKLKKVGTAERKQHRR